MIRKQIATFLTEIAKEELGQEIIFAEDLSDIVDSGTTFLNVVAENKAFDSTLRAIINKVGKTIIVDRTYNVTTPNIVRDAWEYGSILEKIRINLKGPTTNRSWNLTAGAKYDDILVYDPPEVSATYFNKRVTFSISCSYPAEYTLRESFKSASAINRLFSAIANRIRTGMTFYTAMMAQRTINALAVTSSKVINLLSEFNKTLTKTYTVDDALHSPEFFRFAAMTISLYSDYMTRITRQFNNGTYDAHSPKEFQHFCVLSMFAKAIDTYSLSETYHNEFVKLINYETVPYWQGVGSTESEGENPKITDLYSFNAVSKIMAKTADTESPVTLSGVVGILFDRDAAAICNENERVTSFYNADNETTKYYYKWDCGYNIDPAENCIVFVVA